MEKFSGTFDELQKLVLESGLIGTWSNIQNAHKFASSEGGLLIWYPSTKTLQIQGKPEARSTIQKSINYIVQAPKLNIENGLPISAKQKPKVFMVYGHDEDSRDQIEFILTKLDIDYFILGKSSGNGQTIIEALEGHIGPDGIANIGIVLLTPDDMGYAKKEGEQSIKERARQNVILEMGMLMAKLGRANTVIIVKGNLEIPSDADGIIYLGYQSKVREVIFKLVERLEISGCEIDHKRIHSLMI